MARSKKQKSSSDDLRMSIQDMEFINQIGSEPTWDPEKEYSSFDFIRAYNWYNYVLDDKRCLEILIGYDSANAEAYSAIEAWRIPRTVAAKIRMKLRGCPLTARQLEDLDSELKRLTILGHQVLVQEKTKKEEARLPDFSRSIGDVEELLDGYLSRKKPINFKQWLESNPLTNKQAKAIEDYYKPLLAELESAIRGDNQEIREGYANYKSKDLKTYHKQVKEIIEECNRIVQQAKISKPRTPRKPRKPKAINAAKAVKRLKYASSNSALNISSIEPTKLLGAKEVWLYNSKTRLLQRYVAEDGVGIQVKGTTLINYSKEKSEARKLRKPEQIVPSIITDGAKSIVKDFESLKVKPSPCNGRVNDQTLILRAIK